MANVTRRNFIKLAASLGATLAWRSANVRAAGIQWRERREFYPQGVASADPHPNSVILWTRRPPVSDSLAKKLTVEIAEDSAFRKIVAVSKADLSARERLDLSHSGRGAQAST
jgi:alkaline phosphatase D